MTNIILGQYKEYTGEIIEVIEVAENPDTGQEFVLLRYLLKKQKGILAMPIEKFKEQIPNSKGRVKRFTLLE